MKFYKSQVARYNNSYWKAHFWSENLEGGDFYSASVAIPMLFRGKALRERVNEEFEKFIEGVRYDMEGKL